MDVPAERIILMIPMSKKERKELDLFIRAHAQAMYDWGITQENDDLKKVRRHWAALNRLIDGHPSRR